MFTNKILWSLFHSHSVFSIESADTKQLHSKQLVNYLILIIFHLQATAYHVLDTKVKVGQYTIFMKILWNLLLATKEIKIQFTPTFVFVTKLLCVAVFSQWLM